MVEFLDDLINDSYNQDIDFSDCDYMDNFMDISKNELINIFSKNDFSIKQIESILLLAQARFQSLIDWFLQYDCFEKATDLKDAFSYILDCFLNDEKPSADKIEYYISLCSYTGNIVGEFDEDNCTYEEYEQLQSEWEECQEDMTENEQTVADLGYVLFETFYNFLSSFNSEKSIQDTYISQVQDILFSILWTYDEDMEESSVPTVVGFIEEIKSDIMFVKNGFKKEDFKLRAGTGFSLL